MKNALKAWLTADQRLVAGLIINLVLALSMPPMQAVSSCPIILPAVVAVWPMP
jgi:hypothetical protein